MSKQTSIRKQAVDAIAADYWSSYYSESGYGAQWVRKIPTRVKAALLQAEQAVGSKTAATGIEPVIRPLATVRDEQGVSLEGLAIYASADGKSKAVKAFIADFNHTGDLISFDVVNAGA